MSAHTCDDSDANDARACPACSPAERPPGSLAPVPDGERRRLTILFADLVGSTELASRLDPEEWRDVVTGYLDAVGRAIDGVGGRVVKYLGDGVMACFGHPIAYGDDAERAVRAALAVVDATGALDRRLEATHGLRLAVRVGIHTGATVVGAGSDGRIDVFGEAPHVASRIQSIAPANGILVSDATHALVAGLFATDDAGVQQLRGIPEPIRVHRLYGLSGARGRLEAAMPRGLTPFVGREAERQLLHDCWTSTRQGRGHVVVIEGEAGIGKSRLVHRFREDIAEEPHQWLEGYCSPYRQGTPFAPVVGVLQDRLGDPTASLADRLRRLDAMLADVDRQDAPPLVAQLLGLDVPQPLQVAPAEARRRLLAALAAWLFETARRSPVVLVLEDVHWTDPSTPELLEIVAADGADVPLLLLATVRRGHVPPWRPRRHHVATVLKRLSVAETRAIVTVVAARSGRPTDDLLDQLAERADGVPLFAEELTRAVVQPGRPTASAIPATLHDSLVARLDALGPAKAIAQIAAVIGRRFSSPLLQAVSGLDGAVLQQHVDALVDAEIVSLREGWADTEYLFRHALVRDAAYESLLKRRQRTLHQAIAGALVERFPEVAEARPELVAFHYAEAALVADAIPHLRRAGERALARAANREAAAHLTRALELLQSQPESVERDAVELSLLLPLGVAWMAAQGYAAPEAEAAFTRAHELCGRLGSAPALVPALSGLLVFAVVRAQLGRADALGTQLLAMAEASDDTALLANAHLRLAVVREYEGRPRDARDHAEQCLARLDAIETVPAGYGEHPRSAAGLYRALALWRLGHPDRAMTQALDAVDFARRIRHPLSLAQALVLALQLRVYRREWSMAHEEAVAAVDYCTENGFPLWTAGALVHLGGVLAELGRVDEGAARIAEGVAAWQATGARVGSAVFFSLLARCHACAGRIDDGLRVVDEALALTADTGERSEDAELHRLRAVLLLQRPDAPAEAVEAALLRGLDGARAHGARAWELRLATMLARQRRRPDARQMLADVYARFTEGHETLDLRDAADVLATLH